MSRNPLKVNLREVAPRVTLALSFWKNFRGEIISIKERLLDFDDRPYLVFSESNVELRDVGYAVQELNIRSGCVEFNAAFDPMSFGIAYAFHLLDLDKVLGKPRIAVRKGFISVSNPSDGRYKIRATPPIKELLWDDVICGYDEFWENAASLGGWACASIVLQRQQMLKEAVVESDKEALKLDNVKGEIDR